jgi:pimeloyl-ACP methyl ester carboxylesterase/AraC-like DNA-binding protein
MTQPVKYARSAGKNIAYRVTGDGPDTLIIINGWVTNLEEFDTLPGFSDWLGDLSSFTKVILFDKRGVGLSDRVNDHDLPTLADRVDDLRAIIDKEQAGMVSLLGISEGGPMALLFASLHPERVRKVIVYGAFAKWLRSDDHTPGIPMDFHRKTLNHIENSWGSPVGHHLMAPSLADSDLFKNVFASFLRKSASPGAAAALYRMNLSIDITPVLPNICTPVLVIHRRDDRLIPSAMGKYLAGRIPGAKWLCLDGSDHLPWIGDTWSVTGAVRSFLDAGFKRFERPTDDGKLRNEDIRKLHEIRSWLNHHYLEKNSIGSLSRRFGINTFKLKHGFKTLYGIPVIQYVREKRLDHSVGLLENTSLTIKEIAYRTGYQVPGSYSKALIRYCGLSPSQIRHCKKSA